jgi:diguanylate cyclase (GGDEF)-like protein
MIEAASAHALRFPEKLVMTGIAAIALMLAVSSFLTWSVGRQIKTAVASQVDVVKAAERVGHYGTVLELSIKAVVATGDAEAAARYRAVQPELRQTLTNLRSELQLKEARSEAAQIDKSDLALTAMEYEALELVSRGQINDARSLIHSNKYDHLVGLYEEGVRGIEQRASTFVERSDGKIDKYLWATLALSLASFGVLLVLWFAVIRPARAWGKQLEEARAETELASKRLVATQTELQQANTKLFQQARVDPLTALSTRLKFNEDIQHIWSEATREGQSYSLVMCDVDYFKQYNDTYGHPAGDEVLRSVADALTAASRTTDRIYRYGGEEFLILMKTASADAATVCAERFRAAVETMRLPHKVSPMTFVSVSMGVAQLDLTLNPSVQTWIEQADAALYDAKRSGRNRVVTERAKAT